MSMSDKRNLIFVSHAAPEDNVFTLWLSTRLKILGYQVWSDVTRLFGGEKWWEDIEQAVDQFTCKFILVITKTSLSKPGVQREVELALAAEKKYNITNFIIPVIIDDSGFGGQPYGLSERNIIAFSLGWAPALGKLVERLSRDGVPTGEVAADLGKKLEELINPRLQLKKQQSWAISNWLNINSLPTELNFFRIPIEPNSWRTYFSSCPYPWFEWGGMLVSFANKEAFEKCLTKYAIVSDAPRLELNAVLNKLPRNHPRFIREEVIKKVNYLIAEAWNLEMRSKGLQRYELSSGKVAWFYPNHESFSGLQSFSDVYGVVRKKQVIGFSKKNNVFWHYAIEIKAQYGPHAKISLIPHVVFSEDGKTPLTDKGKMHRLRRGFCANWWNDRWRDMLLAYLNMLAGGSHVLKIPVGIDHALSFSSRPAMFMSECSLVDMTNGEPIEFTDEDLDIQVDIETHESTGEID